MTVRIDRHDALDLALYRRVVLEGEHIEVDESLYERVAETRESLLRLVADGAAVYGVTTGLGYLTDRPIGQEDQALLQHSLLTARASGLGGRLPDDVVRGTMLLRLTGFLSGYAAVTPSLCRFLADRLNDGWRPVVPAGPFGASGEISPLAHLFQTFVGEGHVLEGDDAVPAGDALARRGVAPYEPQPKEGSALLNGSPFATALGIHHCDRARALLEHADVAAALAIALVGASTRPYSRRIGELARDPAQLRVHERLLELLAGSPAFEDKLQAPVSFRVVPQVHGAVLDQLSVFEARLESALGAVTDAPLVLPADGDEPEGAYPSGGFHAAAVALALDGLAIGVSQLTNLTEKRLHRLLDARFSGGLPEQLAVDPGRQAGVDLAAQGRPRARRREPTARRAGVGSRRRHLDGPGGRPGVRVPRRREARPRSRQPRARDRVRARRAAPGIPPARRASVRAAARRRARSAGVAGRARGRRSDALGRRRARARGACAQAGCSASAAT